MRAGSDRQAVGEGVPNGLYALMGERTFAPATVLVFGDWLHRAGQFMPARASTGEPGGLWHAETATPPRALRLQATTANALAGRRPYAQPRSPSACPARRSPEDQGETVTAVADTLAAVAGDARLLGEDLASAQTADLEEAL
jgi:hypothetical protein